jgi:AraC-like DNA-binding protein
VSTAKRPPHHNTLTCYTNYGCRLPDCAERYREWDRNRRAARKAGQWQPHVEAEPVRQHLRMLNDHGITLHRAAEMAGIGPRSLHPLFQPQTGRRRRHQHTVRTEIAAKILAIRPETVTPGRVDPTGTARRIQALVAIGWPMRYLAAHFGIGDTYVHQIIQRSTKDHLVLAATAEKIAARYEHVKTLQPARHGVRARNVKQARNMAASRGWPPPKYWADRMDVIDDPDFEPEYRKLRAEILAEEAHWLMTAGGLDRDQAAARLGIARFTIDRALREHPQDEQELAA